MPRVDVRLHQGEPDYSAEVLATFERFKQGTAQRYKFEFSDSLDVNHVEGQILDRVAQFYRKNFWFSINISRKMSNFRTR